MNNLAFINKMKRGTKLVEVYCTATTAEGKSETIRVRVPANKLSKLQGNGLSSLDLYKLKKTGRCESADMWGNKFLYQLGAYTTSADKVQATFLPDNLKDVEIKNQK